MTYERGTPTAGHGCRIRDSLSGMYAVTGVSGAVGGAVAARLAADGHAVRGLVRNPHRAPAIDGVEIVEARYEHSETILRALAGVEAVLMVPIVDGVESTLAEQSEFVAAAARADVKHVVYLSFVGADATSPHPWAHDHGETEELLRGLDVPATILRSALRTDLFPTLAVDDEVRGPAGEGRIALVATDDLVEAAAAVLVDHDASDTTYRLTGPEALTLHEITALSGHRFVPETTAETRARLGADGAPAALVDAWVSTAEAIASNAFAEVSDDLEGLLGRPPTPARDALRS